MLFPMTFWKGAAAPAGISVGRSNSASVTGSGSVYSIGWTSGGAAASGTFLVLIARDNISNNWNISGGAAWTQLGTSKVWYKQCGGSEPTSYSISYSGSAKSETACMSMIEILNASSMEAYATGTNSLTAPNLTGISAGDIAVIVGAYSAGSGSGGAITAPSGYTLKTSRENAAVMTAIAVKEGVGPTSENPGTWAITNSLQFNILASLAFKA